MFTGTMLCNADVEGRFAINIKLCVLKCVTMYVDMYYSYT